MTSPDAARGSLSDTAGTAAATASAPAADTPGESDAECAHERMKTLFAAVCDVPTQERDAVLGHLNATRAERTALETLLSADAAPITQPTKGNLLSPQTDGRSLLARLTTSRPTSEAVALDRVGEVIGPWTIDERIGEGGMGVVYRAKRSDGQFQQTVAIKFLTGVATAGAVQRLNDERHTLAALEHPNIARLIDGGTTSAGVPYIAMDFVKGVSIVEHCRQERVNVRNVVALMLPVCDAVSYAHQSLTLHCDLKPANILVDTAGRPKLLDFGIAELIGRVDGENTAARARRNIAFTPRYSSPEQRAGKKLSTATDIFSLGRLLDELIDDTVARTPKRVHSGLREVRAIAARASAGKASARYDSVAAMRADLERLLQHEPVVAMQGGVPYLLVTLVTRRWAMTIALTVLIVGGIAFTLSLVRERDRALRAELRAETELERALLAENSTRAERDRAQVSELRASEREVDAREAREAAVTDRDRAVRAESTSHTEALRAIRAETQAQIEEANTRDARDFLYSLFDGADPDLGGRPQASAADLLARGRDRVNQLPAEQSDLKSSMTLVLARVYANIGQPSEARLLYQSTIALESSPTGRPAVLADALGQLSVLEFNASQPSVALAPAQKSLAIRREVFKPNSLEVADAHNTLGLALSGNGREEEATAAFEAALTTRRLLLGEKSEPVASTIHNLGLHLSRNGKLVEAEAYFRRALAIKYDLYGKRHPKVLNTVERLSAMLSQQRRFAEAEPFLTDALQTRIELHGPASQKVATVANELGSLLHDMGRYREAEQRYREALNNPVYAPDAQGRRTTAYAVVANNLAGLFDETGDLVEAEKWFRLSLEVRRLRLGPDEVSVARVEHNLARVLTKREQSSEARALFERAHAVRLAKLGVRHGETHDTALSLAELAALQRDATGAQRWLAALDQAVIEQRPARVLLRRRVDALLADLAVANSGLPVWKARAELAASRFGSGHLMTLRAEMDHAAALLAAGEPAAARTLAQGLAAPFDALLAPAAPDRARLLRLTGLP